MPEERRVAMITGGNSGIGYVTASKLAAQGFHVILASRNQESSARAMQRMRLEGPDASVESIPLDLASFAAVRQCAAAFQAQGYPLHILINNAGGSVPGKQASFTADGFELTLGTNHLGHFLLTNLLLEDLKRSSPGAGDHGLLAAAHPRLWRRAAGGFRLRQPEGGKILQPASFLQKLQAGKHVVRL